MAMVHSNVGNEPRDNDAQTVNGLRKAYLNLDPRLLSEDEIIYELKARHAFNANLRSLARKTLLIEIILREKDEAIAIIDSPFTFLVDMTDCRGKIEEIAEKIKKMKNKQDARRIGAKLAHVELRIKRVKGKNDIEKRELMEAEFVVQNLIKSFFQIVEQLPSANEQEVDMSMSMKDMLNSVQISSQQRAFENGKKPVDVKSLEQGLKKLLQLDDEGNGYGNENDVNRERKMMHTQNAIIEDCNEEDEVEFIDAKRLNPDEHFGNGTVQPPFSSTFNPEREGQQMANMFYGNVGYGRPSSIRGSNVHSMNIPRSVNFYNSYDLQEVDNLQRRRRNEIYSVQDVRRQDNSRANGEAFDNVLRTRRSEMFHDANEHRNDDNTRGINGRTYDIHRNGNFRPQIDDSRAEQSKAIPIYRWSISFSGEEKPKSNRDLPLNEFLYLIKVQKEAHGISDATMLSQIHYLLTDKAKTWYFAYYDDFESWYQFIDAIRRRFWSEDHAFESWKQVNSEYQKRDESPLDFLSRMRMMFRSLPLNMSEDMKISVVRRGFTPEIRAIIAPWNTNSLRELEEIVSKIPYTYSKERKNIGFSKVKFNRKYVSVVETETSDSDETIELTREEICMIKNSRKETKSSKASRDKKSKDKTSKNGISREKPGDSNEISRKRDDLKCYNCSEKGHFVRDCKKPLKGIFCFGCGKDDVTINQCCKSKNSVNCLERNQTETGTETSADSDN